MRFQLTLGEGEVLVKLARQAVEKYLKNGEVPALPSNVSPKLKERCGVFVTINQTHNGVKKLRGCIGFPYPTTMLVQAVIESAISSATQDPRFSPISIDELDNVVFEVSVLTPPQQIDAKNPKEYCSKITVGRDGLIVERSFCKGLLLPQVPVEWKWDEETFLCQCCVKAGLSPDSWLLNGTKIYTFQAIIFEEKTPNGEVALKEIGGKTCDS
ncbi:MAG: TIGR00296 family protein [Candidatus Bathyarchaeota archaeon]|nr:MAG: TIGR00296 family protein [Candidatus Bathyarchaeota archaeon]